MRSFYLLLAALTSLTFVHAQDVANFTIAIGTNRTVTISNTSIFNSTTTRKAFWKFGDGSTTMTAGAAGTQHRYTADGTYTVCLVIYAYTGEHDSVATADHCQEVRIAATTTDCKAGFEVGKTNDSLTKLFVAQVNTSGDHRPEMICWNFGDHTDTCIQYNPAQSHNYAIYHHYKEKGTYTVCVKVQYQGGCKADNCHEVKVSRIDSCRIEYKTEKISSNRLAMQFIAQPVNSNDKKPVRLCWKFGDGKDTCIEYTQGTDKPYTVSHVYAHAGNYEACVAVLFDGGCEARYCHQVTIAEVPAPPSDGCSVGIHEVTSNGKEEKFLAEIMTSKVPLKICWNFGDGSDTCIYPDHPLREDQLSIVHEYPGPGRYQLCVKVWYDGGCVADKCRIVEIAEHQSDVCGGYMSFSMAGVRKVLFKGFSVTNLSDHVISWRWNFGDGHSGDGQVITHEYAVAGRYPVCLTILTEQGCETRICKTVGVNASNSSPIIQLSPNPVETVLHVLYQSTKEQDVRVLIFNANGVLMQSYVKNVIVGVNTWSFDVSALPAGIYSLVVQIGSRVVSAAFTKH
jgi:PKD repeat protein